MKGFAVLSSVSSSANAAIESGSVNVIITNKEGKYSLYLGGLDAKGISYTWISRQLLDDEV